MCSRLTRIAASITAACARLNPANGACTPRLTTAHWKRGRCSSSVTPTTASSVCARAPVSRGTGTLSDARVGQSCRPVRQPAKIRTSSVWLATANGMALRLSSVVDGRNGAMIHPSPSAMMPIGVICRRPSAFVVVKIVSRIIGTASARRVRGAQRMPRFAQARAVLYQTVDGTTPIERLVLGVALAQSPCDLSLHQLGTEIEGVRRILSYAELGKERERILRD